jgi:hypothetical protein
MKIYPDDNFSAVRSIFTSIVPIGIVREEFFYSFELEDVIDGVCTSLSSHCAFSYMSLFTVHLVRFRGTNFDNKLINKRRLMLSILCMDN